MSQLTLPDEHLRLIGMIAIRSEVGAQLLDLLLQDWFRDLPQGLMRDLGQFESRRKAGMLHEAFQAALPAESRAIAALFVRLRTAEEDRKAMLHAAWVLAEAPDVPALGAPPLSGAAPRRWVTTRVLTALDRTIASLLLDLTVLYARASEARTAPPSASPDRPGPRDAPPDPGVPPFPGAVAGQITQNLVPDTPDSR